MCKKIKKIFLQIPCYTIVWYILAAVILGICLNPTKAYLKRMNYVTFWGQYPMRVDPRDSVDINKFRRSIIYYQLMSRVFPKYSRAYSMMAYCYYRIGDIKKSISFYQKALELDPKLFWFNYNLGVIYYHQGDYKIAEAYFKKVARGDPNEMIRVAILSSLQKISQPHRQKFFKTAAIFAKQIHQGSQKILLHMYRQKQKGLSKPYSFRDLYLILHPWNKAIDVGKERML